MGGSIERRNRHCFLMNFFMTLNKENLESLESLDLEQRARERETERTKFTRYWGLSGPCHWHF